VSTRATGSAIYMPMIPELPVAMLACTRIGAAHSVIFGGFSPTRSSTGSTTPSARSSSPPTPATGGARRRRSSPTSTSPWPALPDGRHVVVVDRCDTDVHMDPTATTGGTSSWPRPTRSCPRAHGLRAAPLPALHLGHHRQAQGHHAHHRRLPHPGRLDHPQVRVRPQARHRRLLVRGRHRLGHRPQLHRLRAPRQRRHVGHVRGGTPDTPGHGRRTAVGHRREVRGDPALHGAHRHPDVHEVGGPGAGRSTTCRRCGSWAPWASPSTPRPGCGTTPHRRRALPDRRHVVADRDRRPHDHPAARVTTTKPGSATFPHPRHRRRGRRRRRQPWSSGAAATSPSPARGRPCCGASGATPSATTTPTGPGSRAATSPATAPRSTTTATCGCSAGSTTS
jgi:hypothetical protein